MDAKEKDALRDAVYEIVSMIPSGRAASYGAIAKAAGCPRLSRMIGQIMSDAGSFKSGIPAHRVVNSQGILSGRQAFGNGGEMQKLLENEGIKIHNNKIQNWKKVSWNPLEEIQL